MSSFSKYRSHLAVFVFLPAVGLDDHHKWWSPAAKTARPKSRKSRLSKGTLLLITTSRKGALHTGILLTLRIESGDDDDFRDS